MMRGGRAVLAAIVIFAFAPLAHAATLLGDDSTGMIAYWPLNEGSGASPRDWSGENNAATLAGSPTWTTGYAGKALQFGGSPQLASTTLAFPSSGSISLWVYPTSYSDWISPAGWKTLGTTHNGYALLDEGGSGSPGRWRAVFDPTSDSGELDVVALSNITQNAWQHLLMTWSKSGSTYTITFYVNGVYQGSGTWTGASTPSIGHFHFGNSGDYPDNYFLGGVDEVRVYSYALSSAQALALYKLGAPLVHLGEPDMNALQSGLVGYWSMDGSTINWASETVKDMSGQNNTGALINASTSSSPTAGKIGQAFNFNGADYIKVADASSLDLTNNFTISAWVKPSAFGNCNGIVSKYQNNSEGDYFLRLSCSGSQNHYVDFGGAGDFTESTTALAAGKWYHVVGVDNGGTGTIYINGVAVGSGAVTVSNASEFVSIGSDFTLAGARYWSGAIDDVRIYNRPLSSTEVSLLYALGTFNVGHSSASVAGSGLVGYWSMDGSTINWASETVKDMSGSGNTMTLYNLSTSTSPTPGKTGQALAFNGSTQYAATAAGAPSMTSPWSITGWVKVAASQSSSYPTAFGFFGNSTSYIGACFSGGAFKICTDGETGGSGKSYTAGKWYYLTLTYNGIALSLYENGVFDYSVTPSSYNWQASTLTMLGNAGIGTLPYTYAFNGSVDQVRAYSRALSAQGIQQLYAMGQ